MPLRKPKKEEHAFWRPDFRDVDGLPDIKVIRTDFLLNVISVSLAIGLIGLFAYREFRGYMISETIDNLSEEILHNEATNESNVKLSGEFRGLQNGLREFNRFQNVPVLPDELLAELAAMQPDPVILDNVSFIGSLAGEGKKKDVIYTLTLSGTVDDSTPGLGSQVITQYRSALSKLSVLEDYFQTSELTGFSRNEALALFNFTIRIVLSDEPKKSDS
jgi:hypothetical protein